MPDVENNMDELLRKAANNYSLRDGESNWDTISARLIYEPSKAYVVKQKGNVKKLFITSLLVLLFLIAGDIFKQRDAKLLHTPAANKTFTGNIKANDEAEKNPTYKTEKVIKNSKEYAGRRWEKFKQELQVY